MCVKHASSVRVSVYVHHSVDGSVNGKVAVCLFIQAVCLCFYLLKINSAFLLFQQVYHYLEQVDTGHMMFTVE